MLRSLLTWPFATLLPRKAAIMEDGVDLLPTTNATEMDALVRVKRAELEVEMLPPEEAMRSIGTLVDRLALAKPGSPREEYALLSLQALLIGAKTTIHLLNNAHFSVSVPFRKVSRVPSLPTMVADAKKCAEFVSSLPFAARGLLTSFADWAPFLEYETECCCGRSGGLARTTTMRQLKNVLGVRNVADERGTHINLRQYIGVYAETDMDHLYEHYSQPNYFGYENEDGKKIAVEIKEIIGEKKMVVLYGAESVVDFGGDAPTVRIEKYFQQRLLTFEVFTMMAREAFQEINSLETRAITTEERGRFE